MSYDFNEATPIYLQIIEHIKIRIINGEYLSDQKIPSVRDLSMQYEVNPNTVQKALVELENMGLIYTERTNGKYVTQDVALIDEVRKETIKQKIDAFYTSMESIGIERGQVLDILMEGKEQ